MLDGWLIGFGVEMDTGDGTRKLDAFAARVTAAARSADALTRAAKAAGASVGDLGASASAAASGVTKLADALDAQAASAARAQSTSLAVVGGYNAIAASANAAAAAAARAQAIIASSGGAAMLLGGGAIASGERTWRDVGAGLTGTRALTGSGPNWAYGGMPQGGGGGRGGGAIPLGGGASYVPPGGGPPIALGGGGIPPIGGGGGVPPAPPRPPWSGFGGGGPAWVPSAGAARAANYARRGLELGALAGVGLEAGSLVEAGRLQVAMTRVRAAGASATQADELRDLAYAISNVTAQSVVSSANTIATAVSAGITPAQMLARDQQGRTFAEIVSKFADVQYLKAGVPFDTGAKELVQLAHLYRAYTPQQIEPIADTIAVGSARRPAERDACARRLPRSHGTRPR